MDMWQSQNLPCSFLFLFFEQLRHAFYLCSLNRRDTLSPTKGMDVVLSTHWNIIDKLKFYCFCIPFMCCLFLCAHFILEHISVFLFIIFSMHFEYVLDVPLFVNELIFSCLLFIQCLNIIGYDANISKWQCD